MAVRKELIILEMEDHASREAREAATAFKTLDTMLERLDGHATTASRRFTSMTQRADKLAGSMGKANVELGRTSGTLDAMGSVGLVRFSKQADTASASIDRFSGRAALLGTAIMAIGPAALPIAAVAVPALTSLVAGMGAAAGAAGVLTLAFNGIGSAVEAVSEYRLAPTAENLAKVREEMERIGPEAASFVMAIDQARPALEDLQRTARAGIFPGFERALDTLMTQLPGVRDFVADLSLTVGNLGEASANALVNDSDWQEFFDHIGTDGAGALDAFARATGNVVAGAANLVEALQDITGDSDGLIESSRAFREWADNLENTEGFQEFADYVRESGPQVAEFLAATGNAMVGLAKAAAPWGQVVLPALTAFADIVGVIAGSPLGPPLFAAAAAMLVFNKASALMGPNLDRAKSSLGGFGTTLKQTGADLMTMSSGWTAASRSTARDAAAMTAATGRLKGNLASVGEHARSAGPGIAAFGFMASGAAEKMSLSNTALLGMAGAMAGPWGAAIGAGIGLAIDFAKANDEVEKSVTDAASAVASANFSEIGSQMQTAGEAVRTFKADVASFSDGDIDWDFGAYMKGAKNWVEGIFGESDLEELQAKMAKTRTEFSNLVDAGAKLGREFDIDVGGTQAQKLAALQELATSAGPAMSALGITFEDLGNAAARGDGSLDVMVGRIVEWQSVADSATGRTDAVGDAIEQLGDDAISTAASASALSAALDALVAPEQNLIAMQDAMTTSLRTLNDDLAKQNKTLVGNTDAAIKNRAAISDRVTAILQLHEAEAAAGEDPIKLATSLNKQRDALIDAGTAAGMNKKQLQGLLATYNLTPELVKTEFEAAGIPGVNAKVQGLLARYQSLPPKVQTEIKNTGIPKSEADITRLQKKYGLTPPQVRTLAALKDDASPAIAAVIAALRAADGQTAVTTIITRRITEIQTISMGQQTRPDRRIEPDANGGFHVNGVKAFADGGYGMDGRYYSRKPQIIPGGANILWGEKETGWEAYISGKPGERERNLEILAMAAARLDATVIPAAVGQITAYANGGSRGSGRAHRSAEGWLHMSKMWERASKTTERALKDHGKQLDRATDRRDFWNQKRDALKSAVTGSLERDWLEGGTTDIWSGGMRSGTVAYAQQQWKQQAGNSKKLAALIANLRKNGAGDAFIAEILNSSDPLAAAQMFNKQSVAGMRHSQSLYLSATRATASAANSTTSIYADEQRAASRQIQHIRGDIHDLNALLKKQHKESEATRKKYSGAKAAARGSRSKKR